MPSISNATTGHAAVKLQQTQQAQAKQAQGGKRPAAAQPPPAPPTAPAISANPSVGKHIDTKA